MTNSTRLYQCQTMLAGFSLYRSMILHDHHQTSLQSVYSIQNCVTVGKMVLPFSLEQLVIRESIRRQVPCWWHSAATMKWSSFALGLSSVPRMKSHFDLVEDCLYPSLCSERMLEVGSESQRNPFLAFSSLFFAVAPIIQEWYWRWRGQRKYSNCRAIELSFALVRMAVLLLLDFPQSMSLDICTIRAVMVVWA
jgi:hypothetical protein